MFSVQQDIKLVTVAQSLEFAFLSLSMSILTWMACRRFLFHFFLFDERSISVNYRSSSNLKKSDLHVEDNVVHELTEHHLVPLTLSLETFNKEPSNLLTWSDSPASS